MFSIEDRNNIVVVHRPPGRLMRPSDHMIHGHGLGELDGFLDTLKNFGFGAVKMMTGGIYDPAKNRFYVPFSSGNVRNLAQGFVNTSTLGLVKTDKFFGSQTMRTIGTVVGATAAAATAAVGARLVSNYFSGTPTTGGSVTGSIGTTAVKTVAGTAAKTATKTVESTGSLFTLDNVTKALDIGAKVINVGGQVMAGSVQQPQGQQMVVDQGYGMYPPMLPGSLPIDMTTGNYLPAMYNPMGSGGYGGGSTMMMSSGGGGGGGIGPPGSEYYVAEDGTQVPIDGSNTQTMPMWLLVGSGVILAFVLLSPSKGKKK